MEAQRIVLSGIASTSPESANNYIWVNLYPIGGTGIGGVHWIDYYGYKIESIEIDTEYQTDIPSQIGFLITAAWKSQSL